MTHTTQYHVMGRRTQVVEYIRGEPLTPFVIISLRTVSPGYVSDCATTPVKAPAGSIHNTDVFPSAPTGSRDLIS